MNKIKFVLFVFFLDIYWQVETATVFDFFPKSQIVQTEAFAILTAKGDVTCVVKCVMTGGCRGVTFDSQHRTCSLFSQAQMLQYVIKGENLTSLVIRGESIEMLEENVVDTGVQPTTDHQTVAGSDQPRECEKC